MKILLPDSGYTVTTLDYLPQQVFEDQERVMLSGLHATVGDLQSIGVDDVAEELGADAAQAIQSAETDAQREQLLNEARIAMMKTRLKSPLEDVATGKRKADRVKLVGMIETIEKGGETIYNALKDDTSTAEKLLARISTDDYDALLGKVDTLLRTKREGMEKSSGQSAEPLLASPSTVRN